MLPTILIRNWISLCTKQNTREEMNLLHVLKVTFKLRCMQIVSEPDQVFQTMYGKFLLL